MKGKTQFCAGRNDDLLDHPRLGFSKPTDRLNPVRFFGEVNNLLGLGIHLPINEQEFFQG
jgi:hypothetical protein